MKVLGKIPSTIEELLEYPADAAQLSDADLRKILAPYFPHTRPTVTASAVEALIERADKVISDEALLALVRARQKTRLEAEAKAEKEKL